MESMNTGHYNTLRWNCKKKRHGMKVKADRTHELGKKEEIAEIIPSH
jgi:hypothetical protein